MQTHTNLDKKQIKDIFENIKRDSNKFRSENNKDLHAVKAVIVYWIGFCLIDTNDNQKNYMESFDIADEIYP